ncbi:hypothetical protein Tco_0977992 [Tanacetum coccineum]|uniref:Uncharacterized protein n=1 Tax=Tanacetum coccineum TaxID=301880 RepID=A0ABQ5ELP3_9ASTR
MEKLESENTPLESKLQSLIKERDNVKTEYKKLCDTIKQTCTQSQGEINELIEHVNQKTYDYATIHAQNQDLLITISELKAKLKNIAKEEKHVLSNTVTLQTSPNKQQAVGTNENVIAPGMYKVGMSQVANKAKSVLSSTGLIATSTIRSPSNRDSSFKDSVTSNTKNSSEKVENVFIPCHDNYLAKYKLNVRSKVRIALFTTPRTVKSTFKDTTPIVSKTRFFVRTLQSKTVDTTPVVSKAKIDTVTPLSDKNKASKAFTVQDISLSNYMKNKIQTSRMWQKWYELQPNVGWSPVKKSPHVNSGRYTVKPTVSVKNGQSNYLLVHV